MNTKNKKWLKSKTFIYLWVIITLAALVFLFFYLRSVSKKYNTILIKEFENFQSLQEITSLSNKNYFSLFSLLDCNSNDSLNVVRNKWIKVSDYNTQLFEGIFKRAIVDLSHDSDYNALINSRQKYRDQVLLVFDTLMARHSGENAYSLISVQIRPYFINYQNLLEKFVKTHQVKLESYSNSLGEKVKSTSNSIITIGLIPSVILGIIILLTIVFMVVLDLFLRDIDF